MKSLRERSRRTLNRLILKEEATFDGKDFVFKETGLPVPGLQYKKEKREGESSEEDSFDEEEKESDEESEEKKEEKEEKTKGESEDSEGLDEEEEEESGGLEIQMDK